MRVFISWSGEESKRAAKIVKTWLSDVVFVGEDIKPFMSEKDIRYGADWLATLKKQLQEADCAIICLTAENMSAPWLTFEGGAISIVKDKLAIPLLINVDRSGVTGPFAHFQSVTVQQDEIEKLILDIRELGNFKSPPVQHLRTLLPSFFSNLDESLKTTARELSRVYEKRPFVIYPEQVTAVKRGKVFIGAPMASLPKPKYIEMRDDVLRIKEEILKSTTATEVYCPCEKIRSPGQFDDSRKAIFEDFKVLKESEYYIFLYPEKSASSVLLEMGYAIALSKKTTIFTRRRSELPFMLQKADQSIRSLLIVQYRSIDNILTRIRSEGEAFLD